MKLPGGVEFAYPLVLLALLALPLLWWHWMRQPRPVLRFSSLDGLKASGLARRGRRQLLLPALRCAALACLVVGAARPRTPDATTRLFAEGVAIQLVVDTSGSMYDFDLEEDKRLTRLDVVKKVIKRFVAGDEQLTGRRSDLIGVIRFAGYADSICPLTLDTRAVLAAVDRLRIVEQREEDGTAIGDGLGLAVERLRDLKRTVGSGEQLHITSRIVILLTDGENNRGMLTPEQAGELAALHGIRVYTIMAGTGERRGFIRLPVDDRVLREMARVTGGRHYVATDAEALSRIYDEIDELERTRVEERHYTRWDERARPWLLAALAALALQLLLDATLLRRIP